MRIVIGCSACGKRFSVANQHAGKLIRCPECGEPVRVSDGAAVPDDYTPNASKFSQEPDDPARVPQASQRPSPQPSPGRKARAAGQTCSNLLAAEAAKRKAIRIVIACVAGTMLMGVIGYTAVRVLISSPDSIVAVTGNTQPGADAVQDTSVQNHPNVVTDSNQHAHDSAESTASSENSPDRIPDAKASDKKQQPAVEPSIVTTASNPAAPTQDAGVASGQLHSPASVAGQNPDRRQGDRVAWLGVSGNGYASHSNGWIYHGKSADAPFHSAKESVVEFALLETMRTDSMIELFDPASGTRLRLTSDKVVSFPKDSASQHTLTGGGWRQSTQGIGWLTGMAPDSLNPYAPLTISHTDRLEQLIAAVEANVVRIDVTTADGAGNGSGFLLDGSGRIVTNYHVVAGSESVTVVFKAASGNDQIRVNVAGFLILDPKRDIAILQAELPSEIQRPGLKLATIMPEKGSSVVAFGAPLGLDFTASEGIVSGFRSAKELEQTLGLKDHEGQWIQTTAPISPGNSGGPLVDRSGRVVAINTMTLRIGQSLNFAISCQDIRDAVEHGEMYPKSVNPNSVPAIASNHTGSGGNGKELIDVEILPNGLQIFSIEKSPIAIPFLKEIDEVQLVMVVSEAGRSGAILRDLLQDYAKTALDSKNIKVVLDEGPVLLVFAVIRSNDLELVGHLLVEDRRSQAPRLMRVWRMAGNMGELTDAMSRRKRLLGEVNRNVAGFFQDLSETIANAAAGSSAADAPSENTPPAVK